MANRGTGLTKSSVFEAIREAESLGILRHRRNTSQSRGYGPSSYSISWKRVIELARESKNTAGVRSTNRFGRPLRKRGGEIPPAGA